MSIQLSQLLEEEQWILNTLKNIKVQLNALEIEKLHLENLITKHTKLPQEIYLESIKEDAADVEPSTLQETTENEPRLDPARDDQFLEWPELNLRVDMDAPGPSNNFVEEEEEDDDDDENKDEDNSDFQDFHKMMSQ